MAMQAECRVSSLCRRVTQLAIAFCTEIHDWRYHDDARWYWRSRAEMKRDALSMKR